MLAPSAQKTRMASLLAPCSSRRVPRGRAVRALEPCPGQAAPGISRERCVRDAGERSSPWCCVLLVVVGQVDVALLEPNGHPPVSGDGSTCRSGGSPGEFRTPLRRLARLILCSKYRRNTSFSGQAAGSARMAPSRPTSPAIQSAVPGNSKARTGARASEGGQYGTVSHGNGYARHLAPSRDCLGRRFRHSEDHFGIGSGADDFRHLFLCYLAGRRASQLVRCPLRAHSCGMLTPKSPVSPVQTHPYRLRMSQVLTSCHLVTHSVSIH